MLSLCVGNTVTYFVFPMDCLALLIFSPGLFLARLRRFPAAEPRLVQLGNSGLWSVKNVKGSRADESQERQNRGRSRKTDSSQFAEEWEYVVPLIRRGIHEVARKQARRFLFVRGHQNVHPMFGPRESPPFSSRWHDIKDERPRGRRVSWCK